MAGSRNRHAGQARRARFSPSPQAALPRQPIGTNAEHRPEGLSKRSMSSRVEHRTARSARRASSREAQSTSRERPDAGHELARHPLDRPGTAKAAPAPPRRIASPPPQGSDTLEHPSLAHPLRSSCTLSTAPRVSSSGAAESSASSARAHTIVSPTPGSLYRSRCSRSLPTACTTRAAICSGSPGTRTLTICALASGSGTRSSGTGSGASERRGARACGSRSGPRAAAAPRRSCRARGSSPGSRRAARAGTPRTRRRRGRSRRSARSLRPAAPPRAPPATAGAGGSAARRAPPRRGRPRPRGAPAAAASSPSRRGRGGRRCPRGIAGGSGARSVAPARARATSVLPTPASPSSSSG